MVGVEVVGGRTARTESESHRARQCLTAVARNRDLARLRFAGGLGLVTSRHRRTMMLLRTDSDGHRRGFTVVLCAHDIAQLEIELKHERRENQSGESANHHIRTLTTDDDKVYPLLRAQPLADYGPLVTSIEGEDSRPNRSSLMTGCVFSATLTSR